MTAKEWLYQLLDIMVQKEAADLLILGNAPPTLKMAGKLTPMGDQGLTVEQVDELVSAAIPEGGVTERFRVEREANFALSLKGKGRLRVSAFQQRNQKAMVIRRIAFDIPHLEELSLPPVLGELANKDRKSTRLNSSHVRISYAVFCLKKKKKKNK